MIDHHAGYLEPVQVDVGLDQRSFREHPALQVAEEKVAHSHQLGSNGPDCFIVAQAHTDAALARYEKVGCEEIEDGLQVERTQPERTEVLGMGFVLYEIVFLAQDLLQVVVQDNLIGLLEEVRDEDVAVVVGLGERRIEDQPVAFVFQGGRQGDVTYIEDTAGQCGLQAADVGLAKKSTVRRLDDVGIQGHAERRAVAFVEMEGAQVDAVEVQVDFVVVILSFTTQVDVAVKRHLEVRIVADYIGLQEPVLQRTRGHEVVIIVSVEGELLDLKGFDIYRHLLSVQGEIDVGLAREGTQ